jgi:predicted Fe-Mo cluster-binding NifX family protein
MLKSEGESLMKTIFVSMIAAVLLLLSPAGFTQSSSADRIAVAAVGTTPSVAVASQAGRSAYFLMFDAQGRFVEAVANPYKASGNAGIDALDFLAGKGTKVLVAEGFGPRIVEIMKGKGIRPVYFKGSAADAASKALQAK